MILFILSFVLYAHADNQKWYIVPDASDPAKQVIIGSSGFAPSNVIAEAPLDEKGQPYPIEAVEIVEEVDRFGTITKSPKVNQKKLEAKRKEDDDDRKAADMQDAVNKAGRTSRMNRIRQGCPSATGLMKDLCEHVLDQ
jgi:hypothetical protein